MKRILLSAALAAAYLVVFAGPAFAGGGCEASSCTTMPTDPTTTTTIPATTTTTIPTTTSTIPVKPKPAPKPTPTTTAPHQGIGFGGPTTPGTSAGTPTSSPHSTNTVQTLPNTGVFSTLLALLGILCIAGGAVLLVVTRPKSHLRFARN